jgi:hypothetical protein
LTKKSSEIFRFPEVVLLVAVTTQHIDLQNLLLDRFPAPVGGITLKVERPERRDPVVKFQGGRAFVVTTPLTTLYDFIEI